ncbi:MAG: hypothetical protein F6J86_14735 [Symploca sp. SIO1B1]|nr:hypothetical protein [Symploca sp. SIO1B1]
MQLKKLREKAKSLGIIRYSKLRKAELEWLVLKRERGQSIPLKHLLPQLLLKQLTQKPAWEWERLELSALSCKCLEALSYIMGIPKSGKKEQKIQRLLDMAEVREAIQEFKPPERISSTDPNERDNWKEICDVAQQLADKYLGKELRAFCSKVKRFAVSTKWGMAMSLLSWRSECNAKGQRFVQEMRTARKQIQQQENQQVVQQLAA